MTERARLLRLVGTGTPPGRWMSRRQPACAHRMPTGLSLRATLSHGAVVSTLLP